MRRIATVLVAILCGALIGSAQDSLSYPTLDALNALDVPRRDRVQLARELLGVLNIPAAPEQPEPYAVGDLRLFNVNNLLENSTAEIEAELYAVGEHIAVWVDTAADASRERAAAFAREFDTAIYPKIRAIWGEERSPGIDGDPRIVTLFTFGVAPGVAAYYASEHSYPRAVVPTSNEAEMIVFSLHAYGQLFDSPDVYAVTAHEFQHMIRDNLESDADTWLNEGMSVFTDWMLGYTTADQPFSAATGNPRTQLNAWYSTAANYDLAGLFVTYFYERFGPAGLQALSEADGIGIGVVDNALAALGTRVTSNRIYADFAAAMWIRDTATDVRWGFPSIDGLQRPASRTLTDALPQTITRSTPPFATDYLRLQNPPRGRRLHATASFAADSRLIPTDAASGAHLWAAIRKDDSAPTLTRAFDLREVVDPVLDFRVWYDLERDFDFGYVLASSDGGATWDVLATPNTAGDSLYGPSYTGTSGSWLDESVSLADYSGQEILLRFMVITDDALNGPGMAVDDIRIDALGYSHDAESSDDGWEARGWLRTDNRLPTQMWIQIMQRFPGGINVQRILSNGDHTASSPILPDATEVTLAFSPVVPVSTENLDYSVLITSE